ncbi:MAG: PAS domain S-box protein [Microcoleaceae cyanobacterium]
MQKVISKEQVNLALAIKRHPLLVQKDIVVSQVLQLMKSDANLCNINNSDHKVDPNSDNTSHSYGEEIPKSNNRPDCVLVVENTELVGIFTVRDAIKLIAEGDDLTQTSISQVMKTSVFSIQESEITNIFALINLMQQRHIRHLPILDADHQIVGLVSHESLRSLVQPFDLLKLRSVKEVMNIDVVKAPAGTYMLELSRLMTEKRVSCVVLTEAVMLNDHCVDQPVGIVTEGDIVEWQAMGVNLVSLQAYSMMKETIYHVRPQNTLLEAHHLMNQYGLQRLLVVGENQELLGILTQTTILQAIDPWEIYNLAETLQLQLAQMQNEKLEMLAHRNTLLEAEIEKRKILESKLQEKVKEAQDHLTMIMQQKTQRLEQINSTLLAENRERALAEAALKRERNFVDMVLKTVSVLILVLDQAGKVIRFNAACEKLTGLSEEDVIEQDFWDLQLIIPGEQLISRQVFDNLRQGKALASYHRNHWLNEQGEMRLINWSNSVVTNYKGEVTHIINTGIDITENYQAQMELMFHAQITKQIHDSVVATDMNGHITYWNHGAERVFGYLAKEVLGKHINVIYPPEEHDFLNTQMIKRLLAEGFHETEVIACNRQGDRFCFQLSLSLLMDENGKVNGLIGYSMDITERKMAESLLHYRLKKEKLINQIALIIRRSLDLHQILNRTLPAIRGFLKCDRLLVYQFTPDWDGAVLSESVGPGGWQECLGVEIHDPCFQNIGVKAYVQGRINMIKNVEEIPRDNCYRELLDRFQIKANLVIPIILDVNALDTEYSRLPDSLPNHENSRSNLWGLLIAHQCSEARYWQQTEVELLQEISTQLSIAIQQTELYRQMKSELQERQKAEIALKQLNEQLEMRVAARTLELSLANQKLEGEIVEREETQIALTRQERKSRLFAEISLKIRQSLDLEQILQTTVDEVRLILQCDRVLVYRILPDGGGKAITESALPMVTPLLNQEFSEKFLDKKCQTKYLDGEVKAIDDVNTTYKDDMPCLREFLAQWQIKAKLVVPIIQRGSLWGFIIGHRCFSHLTWTEFEIELMGQIGNQLGVALEQSELLATVQEILEKLRRQLAAVEASVDGVAILRNNQYVYLNNAHLQIFGYEKIEELLGKDWQVIYEEDEMRHIEQDVLPELKAHQYWRGTSRAKRKDGSIFDQELSLTITADGDLICVCRDISERRRWEIQLKQTNEQLTIANEELAKASQLKSEFLANMSHELRTPLNSILGLSQVLQEEVFGDLNSKQQQSLQTIYNSGQHLLELINDILELAKIESGKLELHKENISVLSLCQNSLSIVKSQATKKNIQLHLLLTDHSLQVIVDERRIRQVLINLLSNAVKFTPDHGTVTLQVDSRYEEKLLLLQVIDTGIGISPEDQGKLFQAFVQIDSKLSRRYEGTGLGLVLVKQIVEMHGGTVTLTSKLGEGSCFTISLPWQPSERSPEKTLLSEEQTINPVTVVNSSKKPLILLAEDNQSNIETIFEYLEIKGYEILLASNGLQAVELALAHQPQLILMDIQMPEMDGIEATQKIRQEATVSHIPIIALTALTMPADRKKCLEAGANDYLSKPFRLQELVAKIQEHILVN